MILGLYAAANGMMSVEARQNVIANNLANVMTPGFRRQGTVQEGFYQVFRAAGASPLQYDLNPAPGGGTKLFETYTDPTEGAITHTGDPLNIALSGPGFLAVDTPQGVRFTRAGRLGVNSLGQLITSDGHPVEAVGGSGITVSGGTAQVDDQGNVTVDGQPVGQLRLVEFANPGLLHREGANLYSASPAVLQESGPATNTRVIPDSLELSNVQTPTEMVNMLMGLRAYEADQKVLNAVDDTLGQLIEQVGMPV